MTAKNSNGASDAMPIDPAQTAIQALKSAQSNIGPCRPVGSSDPESEQYDHDAFEWDCYQRAIDGLSTAATADAQRSPGGPYTNVGAMFDAIGVAPDAQGDERAAFWAEYPQGSKGEKAVWMAACRWSRAALSRQPSAPGGMGEFSLDELDYIGKIVFDRVDHKLAMRIMKVLRAAAACDPHQKGDGNG